MFGRTKGRSTAVSAPPVVQLEKVGGKNRPTPRRATAEAANRRPLVASDRRGATAASRAGGRDERRAAQAGRIAGEERYLPTRDRGPVRAHVRDVVDARRNLGEWFLLYVLVLFVLQFAVGRGGTVGPALAATYVLLYGGLLAVVVDLVLLRRRVRTSVARRFGAEAVQRGLVSYAVTRSLQMRRSRIPRPAVPRGGSPR